MSRLPVIVAQGGVSPAGRTSGFHGYRRLVIEALREQDQCETILALRVLRNMSEGSNRNDIFSGTLVRQIVGNLFNHRAIPTHTSLQAESGSEIIIKKHRLPNPLPDGWQLEDMDGIRVKIRITDNQPLMVPSTRVSKVSVAGQLPTGFVPEKMYQSRNHPRSLAMTVFGASDAIYSSGMDWDKVKEKLSPEEIAVYSGSAMSQLDFNGNGGLLQSRLIGKRVTSKQCPLGFAEMSADFINAYILGSLGGTGTSMGACSTMLYNLERAVSDITSGHRRVVVVGNSEAPITPEIIEGYHTMGALATDDALRRLDELSASESPNWRMACRPFGYNAGFTLAESSQFLVLMDDAFALECGAEILGAVAGVCIHADGYKKSISAPGVGNNLTVARAAALARGVIGHDDFRNGSFVQAHGTGTPQNRVTESQILNETAKVFGIKKWPVTAVKSYLGHSIGAAGGDQIMSTLGVWKYGYIPGIKTVQCLADDVYSDNLNILLDHFEVDDRQMKVALINAKGFGGNNATALLLSPDVTKKMIKVKHGMNAVTQWQHRNESVTDHQYEYERCCIAGTARPIYRFGEGVLQSHDLKMDNQTISVPGFGKSLCLEVESPFWDF